MLLRDLADGLEIARLRQDDTEVHHRRFHDHAGRLAVLGDEPFDPTLHRFRVVEGHRDRHVGHDLRDPEPVGDRLQVEAVADRVVVDTERDHHVVVMAVVGAEDLHDRVATGDAPGDPDRVHRRLRAGVDVAPVLEPPATGELLADDDRILGRRGEVRPEPDPVGDGLRDHVVRVALHHRAEAVVEVEVLVAVDVPDLGALAVGEVDRPRIARLVRRGDAAGEALLGAGVEVPRALGSRIELRGLALGQLLDSSRDRSRRVLWSPCDCSLIVGCPHCGCSSRRSPLQPVRSRGRQPLP